jgi:site-specific DNA-methyltransferase (adenine-specific)
MNQQSIIHGDCLEVMKNMDDSSIDCIITDPPYGYLNHRLDKPFDENEFFKQCFRILKQNSFLCFFGRGSFFYRWNCICSEIGFKFMEELVWDKSQNSNPMHRLQRIHETIAVYVKGKKQLNKVRINKIEYDINSNQVQKLQNDLRMLVNGIKKIKTKKDFDEFMKGDYKFARVIKHSITINKDS